MLEDEEKGIITCSVIPFSFVLRIVKLTSTSKCSFEKQFILRASLLACSNTDERSYMEMWRNCSLAKCDYVFVIDVPVGSRRTW